MRPPDQVTVTHPFHPLRGRSFGLTKRVSSRHSERIWVVGPDGTRLGFPASWTSMAAPDPWLVVAGGRSPFRLDDLLAVADGIERIRSAQRAADGSGGGDV